MDWHTEIRKKEVVSTRLGSYDLWQLYRANVKSYTKMAMNTQLAIQLY